MKTDSLLQTQSASLRTAGVAELQGIMGMMQQQGHSEPRLPRRQRPLSSPEHCNSTEFRETCCTFLGFSPRCVVQGVRGGSGGGRVEVKGQEKDSGMQGLTGTRTDFWSSSENRRQIYKSSSWFTF